MELQDASLLRVFLSEDDVHNGRELHHAILAKAHSMEIAGGTVLRGVGGYGPASLQIKHFQFRTEGHPLVLEFVDTEEKINLFLPVAAAMLDSGAMTVERVKFYAKPSHPAPS